MHRSPGFGTESICAEQRRAAIGIADRERPRTVERRPDELSADARRGGRPRRRHEGSSAGDGPGKDAKPVALWALGPAHEAGRKRVMAEAAVPAGRTLGLGQARGLRQVEGLERGRNRAGYELVAIQELRPNVAALHTQRPVEGRRES